MTNRIRVEGTFDDEISGKLKRVRQGFDDVEGSSKLTAGAIGRNVEAWNLFDRAADAAVGFMFDSVHAASNLEQAQGAVETIFKSSADELEAFGETAASVTGQSAREFDEAAAIIGAKLQGMGFDSQTAASTFLDLDKRAADMAATFGGTTKDAIDAISSALSGERDPIEKYGVSIKQADVDARILALGLDTSTVAAQKQATATATLSLIMDQTATSAGKFAGETDTLAHKQQVANAALENGQATLGEKLAPLFERFTEFMTDVGIPALSHLADILGEIGGVLATVAKAAADAFGWLEKVTSLGQDTKGAFDQGLAKYGLPTPGSVTNHAAGGWAGLHGPELSWLGEGGEPELVTPRSQLADLVGGAGVRLEGVTMAQIQEAIEDGILFRLRTASSGIAGVG